MTRLRFLTAGESHGEALVGILEGLPSGIPVTAEALHRELLRRKLGAGRGARQKMEDDQVRILAGVRYGMTLGSPVALLIENRDWANWQDVMRPEPLPAGAPSPRRPVEVPRPGHADYVGGLKYAHEDMRNVLERSSARETAMRVALGSLARIFLQELGVGISSRVLSIGEVEDRSPTPAAPFNEEADRSPVRCLCAEKSARMASQIESAKKAGETLGGIFEVVAFGVPVALGSPMHWDRRIEAPIARSFMSLNAIKGVEIGLGFEAARTPGSLAHDELFPAGRKGLARRETNRAGGIEGGMTTGEPLVVRAAMKPLSTLMKPLRSVKLSTHEPDLAHVERSDVCAVPAAGVIGESLLALVLAEAVLERFGGDTLAEVRDRVEAARSRTE